MSSLKISLICVCSLISKATAEFTPPNLFCATADGQIACNIPCPEVSKGSPSKYCTGLTDAPAYANRLNFTFCLATSSEFGAAGTNHCPAQVGGRCSDIGKTCALPKGAYPMANSECPSASDCDGGPSDFDGSPSPQCDGTCGCGCGLAKSPTWLGIPESAVPDRSWIKPAPVDGCAVLNKDGKARHPFDVTDAASIYQYCV